MVFYFSSIFFNRYALSFLPDSFLRGKYPYFYRLHSKFRKFNKKNNGGDIHRLNSFILNIEHVVGEKQIEGDFAELGAWMGNTTQILALYAKKFERKGLPIRYI